MLKPDGHFAESNADEVSFPEDSPAAFEIIVRIIHGQFASLPDSLDHTTLVGLAPLTDKYDLLETVRPFIPTFTSSVTRSWPRPEETLFTAWTFGLQNLYIASLQTITDHGRIKANDILCSADQKLDTCFLSGTTKDLIIVAIRKKRQELLSIGSGIIRRVQATNWSPCQIAKSPGKASARKSFATLIAGSLALGLSSVGISLGSVSDNFEEKTVGEIAILLEYEVDVSPHNLGHTACVDNLGFGKLIADVEGQAITLSEDQDAHFINFHQKTSLKRKGS
ncbi:hypothetical protein EJ08DRAFT_659444 [Tothia fuscella]|uniref:Uncharacterized protein n=1 Tax=Tothia fuscella TaxID=1048955 RepID=A0A9P4NTV4_9PEZI|nr:hypothetical protein EJ08DRAFT_659444 [Tothia fuscella]